MTRRVLASVAAVLALPSCVALGLKDPPPPRAHTADGTLYGPRVTGVGYVEFRLSQFQFQVSFHALTQSGSQQGAIWRAAELTRLLQLPAFIVQQIGQADDPSQAVSGGTTSCHSWGPGNVTCTRPRMRIVPGLSTTTIVVRMLTREEIAAELARGGVVYDAATLVAELNSTSE